MCSIEYNVSYVYHSLYAYFDRDNVGLPGMAAFFKVRLQLNTPQAFVDLHCHWISTAVTSWHVLVAVYFDGRAAPTPHPAVVFVSLF